jgi:AcrR family transcriptional regulator
VARRRTPDDFFEAGMQLLEECGFPGLTTAGLCGRMGVTRGSFYHHFESLPAYIEALLEFWENRYSRELISRSPRRDELSSHIRRQAEMATELPHGAEVALRAWGTIEPTVRVVLTRVDELRQREIGRGLERYDVPAEAANTYATAFIASLIGAQVAGSASDQSTLLNLLDSLDPLLLPAMTTN